MDANDPIVASYDVFLTDSQIARYVFQFPDRDRDPEIGGPYNEGAGQKPAVLRMKPKTGLVEIDVPINTSPGYYDTSKGIKYGESLKESRVLKGGGAFGLAGGFNPNATSRVKMEGGSAETTEDVKSSKIQTILRTQTLAGRIKDAHEGDPMYMLGAFRGSMCRNSLSFLK
jgi:DNA-directed RNA polymerase